MGPRIAIVGDHALAEKISAARIDAVICPATEPRSVLRWVMDLTPDACALCIIIDNEGRTTASLTTALDPAIPAITWAPAINDADRFLTSVGETSALICAAPDLDSVVEIITTLLRLPQRPQATVIPAIIPVADNKATPPVPAPVSSDEDHALYHQLEAMMAAPIKDTPRPQPIQVQQPSLDFSVSLRRLMSAGRALAHRRAHVEVLGAHYLASLEEPYSSAFNNLGLGKTTVDSYLSGLDGGEEQSSEPVISDEVFQAVSQAKQHARQADSTCVRVADFLGGLLSGTDTSVSDILAMADVSPDQLLAALAHIDGTGETCEGSFFAPSSLDQESFYQFDPAQVRNVEQRLKTLPGFQKAAERIAESKKPGPAPEKLPNAPVMQPVLMPVPDKPELVKITSDFPPVDIIEHVADRLLEGQVIAFPSDVMFALAADAANPAAVERLRAAAGLHQEKRLSILVNSTSQLKHLVRADLDALEEMFDELWPGPLTLIFKAAGSLGRHLAVDGTVAIRQPSDNISLAILSMLGRPLAVTSWDESPPPGTSEAPLAATKLTGQAALVMDNNMPAPRLRTTVVDLTQDPWLIIREGAIPGQSVLSHRRSIR